MEMMVALSLILIATALLASLFVPSMSLFRRQSGKSDVYRGCLMVMDRFRTGLMNSQFETITIDPTGSAVSWQLTRDDVPFSGVTGDPLLTPDFGLLYYKAGEQKVYYKVHTASVTVLDRPTYLSLSDLLLARDTHSPRTQVIGRNVVEFKITDKDGDIALLEPPLRLTVTCEVDTKGRETNDVERFVLAASVTPRSMRW